MKINACSNLIHPQEIRYASNSKPGHTYVVVTESILNDSFCTCPGWRYRERCSHVEDALRNHTCNWYVIPEEEGYELKRCPQCGSLTEEFETEPEFV